MPENRRKLRRVAVSVEPDDYDAFMRLAERWNVSASWLIRMAMREFRDRYGEGDQPELPLVLVQDRQ